MAAGAGAAGLRRTDTAAVTAARSSPTRLPARLLARPLARPPGRPPARRPQVVLAAALSSPDPFVRPPPTMREDAVGLAGLTARVSATSSGLNAGGHFADGVALLRLYVQWRAVAATGNKRCVRVCARERREGGGGGVSVKGSQINCASTQTRLLWG